MFGIGKKKKNFNPQDMLPVMDFRVDFANLSRYGLEESYGIIQAYQGYVEKVG